MMMMMTMMMTMMKVMLYISKDRHQPPACCRAGAMEPTKTAHATHDAQTWAHAQVDREVLQVRRQGSGLVVAIAHLVLKPA